MTDSHTCGECGFYWPGSKECRFFTKHFICIRSYTLPGERACENWRNTKPRMGREVREIFERMGVE